MACGICANRGQHLFVLRIICGTSANDAHFCMMLAEVPQASYSFVLYLRKFRKYHVVLCCICGRTASIMQFCVIFAEVPQAKMRFCNIFAEVPQMKCNFGTCLQENCKQRAILKHVCSLPANVVQSKKRLKSERANLVACAWDVWRVIAGLLRGNDDENKCVARGFGVDIEP